MHTNVMHTLTRASRWNVKWSVKYKVYLCPVAFKYTFNVQWHECVALFSQAHKCVERWDRLWFLDLYWFSVNSGDNNKDDALCIILLLLLSTKLLHFEWLNINQVIIIIYIRIQNYSLVCASFFVSVFIRFHQMCM